MADDPAQGVVDDVGARPRRSRACTCSTARSCRPRSGSTRRRRSRRWPSAAPRGSWRRSPERGAGATTPATSVAGRARSSRPASLEELVALVQRAEREGTTVRAVGAGHAWSDVALTDGFLVEPDRLERPGRARRRDAAPGAAGRPARRACWAARRCARSTPRSTARASRCRTWAATTRRRSPASSRPRPTARACAGARSRTSCARSTSSSPAARWCASSRADGPTDPAAFAAAHGDGRRLVQDDAIVPPPPSAASACLGLIRLARARGAREVLAQRGPHAQHVGGGPRRRSPPDGVLGEGDHYELFVNPYARKRRRAPRRS